MHTKLGSHDHNWVFMHKIFVKYEMISLRACEHGLNNLDIVNGLYGINRCRVNVSDVTKASDMLMNDRFHHEYE